MLSEGNWEHVDEWKRNLYLDGSCWKRCDKNALFKIFAVSRVHKSERHWMIRRHSMKKIIEWKSFPHWPHSWTFGSHSPWNKRGRKLIEIIYKTGGKEKVSERVQAELLNSFTHSGANLSRHSIFQCLITELFDCCWINLGIQWREIKLPIEAIWGFQIGLSADCFLSRSPLC